MVSFGSLPALDVQDAPTIDDERVGDQRTMTSRGESFGAHDRRDPFARLGFQTAQAVLEVLRLHVVRESAEGGVDPARVRGILAGVSSPAQRAQMLVSDVGGVQGLPQCRLIVLRIMARAWNRPNVDDLLDPVRFQQLQEVADGAGRMTDGVQDRLRGGQFKLPMEGDMLPVDTHAILTRDEVAAWLKVKPRQVERLGVPQINLGRKTRRYFATDVLTWLDAKRGGAATSAQAPRLTGSIPIRGARQA